MVDVTLATASLVIEMTVLVLLAIGYILRGRKKYREHGIMMTTAVILHLVTIFSVMIPSLIEGFFPSTGGFPGTIDYADPIVIISLVHVSLGIIAASIGVWLVTSWHLRTDVGSCFPKKRFMVATLTIWVIAILLGIALYLSFWANQLLP
jgi:uncharacterized membrane protein YozB (DUF420 family)